MHILLIGSEKDVAYASYYLVGTISSSSNDVQNYHTRVSQVLEKINGKWVIRGAHYSRFMGPLPGFCHARPFTITSVPLFVPALESG